MLYKQGFLPKNVYKIYRETVKGNEDTSYDQASRKMYRNMLLAYKSERPDGSHHYKYGCLHFNVANNKVVWMRNNNTPQKGWKRNNREYIRLNKELGINDEQTLLGLLLREVKCQLKYNATKLKWKIKLAVKG